MSILDRVVGSALATADEHDQRISAKKGVAIFGLDALSSAAYGPEAALTLLLPLGVMGSVYLGPITLVVILLLAVVFFSYRQTIDAYPGGGGSYTVAGSNLGSGFGLLAGAALMIDYILNVAVGIAAGVGAIVSAVPSLQPHMVALCIGILLLIAFLNLRGVKDTGAAFVVPTYVFVASLFALIVLGAWKVLISGGHPVPVVAPPVPVAATLAVPGLWLLLKAFASGCTAMTGVEAVSNGVGAFQQPVTARAKHSLTMIIGILMALLAGLAFLVAGYHVTATDPAGPHYQSVLSILLAAVAGRGIFYYVAMCSIALVLCLSANTSYADFPRLCRVIALDRFLPTVFSVRGRRLVYTHGVVALTIFAGLLLVGFRGVTDRLIPLFAVGAFLAFTLSQAGMVVHWRRLNRPGLALVNGVGAVATGITVCIVMVAKFVDGAWIILLLVPTLCGLMVAIRHHYHRISTAIFTTAPLTVRSKADPIVVLPIERWTRVSRKALAFAMRISDDVRVVHVAGTGAHSMLQSQWEEMVETPAHRAGVHPPTLTVVPSPYRFVLLPILHFVRQIEQQHPQGLIAVMVPELVERRWYHHILHNQRAAMLKALLFLRGTKRMMVINVPWYVE
ncbi:amino acid/polyamine/organocation transporter, APC superfamily [Terriglobus roseus DSM 18391]|uniref:Amino acid/polyamine/organocation transporter, APC superfamily n=1 Tax=Terriglobus roseus (strain DSM 18391 / NRRL B-41598 / KBS 63) TaxID=926566 RepID=I3ZLU2_TERRK|nr:APC family permease [Terriglobus roseus]AFL90210.1 amino acid/polyamine/organocation transporter, APC superfamily [Terriglobus roseus DSM 18391]